MAALTAALLALTAANTISSAVSQKRQGDFAARAADTNAGLADQQASDAIARGEQDVARSRLGTRQLIGSQRAAIAGNGVDVGSGTSVDLQSDAAGMGALDALTLRNNAAREAFGYKVDAMNSRNDATMTRDATSSAVRSTLLTGAANMYGIAKGGGMFAGRKKAGGGGGSSVPDWAD